MTGADTVSLTGKTQAAQNALVGYSITSTSLPNQRILVVGEGGAIAGPFAGLAPGEAQYAVNGAIVSESGLAAALAGLSSGDWYRRIGYARDAVTINPNFGEPQQVP
jgi:hypothetical protein